MVTPCKFIIAFFALALLTQCVDKKKDTTKIDFPVPAFFAPNSLQTTSYHPTSYYGEWGYNFPFYSSELVINKDGTFKFHEQGCTGHSYSEGKWVNNGINILLTSFEKYSYVKPTEITEIKSKIKSSTTKRKKTKDKIEYTLDPSIINTNVTYKFSAMDTLNEYFDKVQLRLEGDTLYRLDNNGLKTETKYILTKSNR